MKVITSSRTRSIIILVNILFIFLIVNSCTQPEQAESSDEYYVAAYIWPSCHHDERFGDMLWPEGTGEWEVIKKGNPRFEGHHQPKVPLWGYELDNDPKVMERWIDAAVDHGVNVFIFDWYWYDEGPYLESSLNDGFLKAANNEKMNFYVMWANHDVRRNYWNVHKFEDDTTILWNGAVDMDNFKIIVDRVINQYFKQPNYFKIDGKPVFSIFSLQKLVESFGSVEETVAALEYFRDETSNAGFPGLHIQGVLWGSPNAEYVNHSESFGFDSFTNYNWGGPHPEDYIKWGTEAIARRDLWDAELSVPFFPNASIGWDDTPRFPAKGKQDVVHYNNTPVSFAAFLDNAKRYCDDRPDQPNLITIFSWNEWVEGGYLLPDVENGFGYLEAVNKVMSGEYDPYYDKP
jgi:hypothetical protein